MSGRRCLGSSSGRGLNMSFEDEFVSSKMVSANSIMVNSPGLPRLMGPVTDESLAINRRKPSMRSSQ